MERAKVSAKGLVELKNLKKLKSLNLNTTGVGDDVLEILGEIASLESIQLDSARISDAGMPSLANVAEAQATSYSLLRHYR